MVTHSSTSRPVQCLCMAERTGCPVLTDLWSYVLNCCINCNIEVILLGGAVEWRGLIPRRAQQRRF
jgi:hypothetical protein